MDIDLKTIDRKRVRIKLKAGETLIGYVHIDMAPPNLKEIIPFLTDEKNGMLKARLGNQASKKKFVPVVKKEVEDLFEFIPFSAIENYELVETEIHTIRTVNQRKQEVKINNLELYFEKGNNPGFLHAHYKVPNYDQIVDLGESKIREGIVEIEVSVAFLSYAREDEKTVKKLAQKLNRHGIITWFDKRNIGPGDDWELQIEEAIEKSDFFLVFLSKETQQKIGYKNRELELALKQQSYRPRGKVFIIPILLDECTPPHDLKKFQWMKIADDPELLNLAKTIAPRDIKIRLLQESTSLSK